MSDMTNDLSTMSNLSLTAHKLDDESGADNNRTLNESNAINSNNTDPFFTNTDTTTKRSNKLDSMYFKKSSPSPDNNTSFTTNPENEFETRSSVAAKVELPSDFDDPFASNLKEQELLQKILAEEGGFEEGFRDGEDFGAQDLQNEEV
jgi:hypothetical protein